MKYFVHRDGREYGPYDIDELRRYTAEGRISPSDGLREAGASGRTFGSVHEVINSLEPAPPQSTGAAAASPYAAPASWQSLERMPAGYNTAPAGIPMPPSMEWWVLLLLSLVTCGIFAIVRMFTQANYAKKVDPENQSSTFYGLYLLCVIVNQGVSIAAGRSEAAMPMVLLSLLLSLATIVFVLLGHFKLRASLEKAFNQPLSGVMTFFFNVFYFQYHMHRVATAMKAQGMA